VRFAVPVAAREWAATAARLLLAGVWVWAGVAKIGDPAAAVRAVRAYRLLPEWLAQGVGYGLPFLELTLAALLLAGLATRLAAAVSAALLVVFLAGVVSAAARGLQIECGCFGGGGDLAAGQSTAYTGEIVRDAALLLVALALARWPRGRLAADAAVRARAESKVDTGRPGPRRTAEARRRMAELAERRRREGERRVRTAAAVAGVLLVAVTGIGVGVQAARASRPSGPVPQAVSVAEGVTVGRSSARLTIEIYEDPQCPACRQFELEAGAAVADWVEAGTAKVNYHIISFLDGASTTRYSSRAANAMYCAADAGVFQRYHGLLFVNQPAEGSAGLTYDQLVQLGRQAGATGDAFETCVRNRPYADFVARISEQASRDGVLGTPTVLVDGSPVQPVTLAAVRAAVNEAS
jgi:protein-disulfide isomerase